MSALTYNGITLPFTKTNGIEFRPQRSDDGMDYLYTKGSFDVRAVVSADQFAAQYPGKTATEIMSQVEHKLNQPRKEFHYAVNGQDLVALPAGPDAANGPFGLGVSVQEVNGSECYIINFKIEVAFIQCPDPPGNPQPTSLWVSHRWTESQDIDQAAFSTITRRGKIVARGDMTSNADQLRGLIAPTLGDGFLRESAHYELASDGLSLVYTFVDKEVYLQPPGLIDSVDDAYRAEGSYTQSSTDGAVSYGECHVRLWGAKNTSKTDLMRQAIVMCMAKLEAGDVQKNPKTGAILLKGAVLRTELYENSCEVSIRAMLKGLPARHKGVPVSFRSFESFPDGSEPGIPPTDTGDRGSAGLLLVAQALKDPCLQTTVLQQNGAGPNTSTLGTGPPPATVIIRTLPPDDLNAKLKTFNDTGLFTTYEVNTTFHLSGGAFLCPVGSQSKPAQIITTAGATMTKVAEWTAAKVGSPPTLPSPSTLGDPNLVVLDVMLTSQETRPYGDGVSQEFVISGRYLIAAKEAAKMIVGPAVPPWMEPGPDGRQVLLQTFQQSQFQTGIIDYADQNNGPTLAFMINGPDLQTGGAGANGGPGN